MYLFDTNSGNSFMFSASRTINIDSADDEKSKATHVLVICVFGTYGVLSYFPDGGDTICIHNFCMEPWR